MAMTDGGGDHFEEDDGEEWDGYFTEVLADATLTGKEPKFVLVPELAKSSLELAECRVDELIQYYRAIRDQLATDRKGYKAREARMKLHLSILSLTLRDKGDTMGVDNFKTDAGTAFRKKNESIRVVDWDAFLAWLKETGNFHTVQKRVSPLMVKEIRDAQYKEFLEANQLALQANPDKAEEIKNDLMIQALPPGLNSFVEVEFAVRSPTSRKK